MVPSMPYSSGGTGLPLATATAMFTTTTARTVTRMMLRSFLLSTAVTSAFPRARHRLTCPMMVHPAVRYTTPADGLELHWEDPSGKSGASRSAGVGYRTAGRTIIGHVSL